MTQYTWPSTTHHYPFCLYPFPNSALIGTLTYSFPTLTSCLLMVHFTSQTPSSPLSTPWPDSTALTPPHILSPIPLQTLKLLLTPSLTSLPPPPYIFPHILTGFTCNSSKRWPTITGFRSHTSTTILTDIGANGWKPCS